MDAVKINIAPCVLEWVLAAVNTDNTDNTDNAVLKGAVDTLKEWHSGSVVPTFSNIEKISKKTHIPFGYFFLQSPPDEQLPLLEYRTVDSLVKGKPSRNLIDTIKHMESIQEWMYEYRLDNGYSKLPFVGLLKGNTDVALIAQSIRDTICVNIDWYAESTITDADVSLRYMRERFEGVGLLVIMYGIVGQNSRRQLNIDEFRAFTLLHDYVPLVFINASDSAGARLFSLIHEAVHVWLGEHSFYNDRHGVHSNKPLEKLCNAVTAEILVPNTAFVEEWKKNNELTENRVKKLARIFKCGELVIARRALDSAYITQQQYKSISDEAIVNFNKQKEMRKEKRGGGDYYRTNISRFGRNFILALHNSIKEGKTLDMEAFRLTRMNVGTFDKLVSKARGVK
ncbi:ImmA/IrrE family metallo-endopeptidase [Deferribacterales bacterium RsTz2092]|nr:DNA-binding protein [Deferribacterales bacterium]